MNKENIKKGIELLKGVDTGAMAIFFISQMIFPLKDPDQYMFLYLMNIAIIVLYAIIDITFNCEAYKIRNTAMIDLVVVHILILILTFGTMFNVTL